MESLMNPFYSDVFDDRIVWLKPIIGAICTSAILTLGKFLLCINRLLWKIGVRLPIVLQG